MERIYLTDRKQFIREFEPGTLGKLNSTLQVTHILLDFDYNNFFMKCHTLQSHAR